MKLLLIALLCAISYAQTAGASAGQGMGGMGSMMQGMGMPGNFMQYAMMDQMDVIDGDLGDMVEDMAKGMFGMDVEDLFDMGMMFAGQYMNGQGGSQGAQGGSQGMPDLGGLVNGLFGGQGAGMGSMMPYMYMDGGDMFDGMEDMYKYGMGMPMMGGMGMGGQRGQQQQKSRRLRMPRHNRLLSKPHMKKRMLRKPREFYLPFLMGMMNQAQQNPQGTAQNAMSSMLPFFGYDGMDSEDRAAALMMGANPNSLPPPVDGIDGEDMWMYANTRYNPMNMFKRSSSSSGSSSTAGDSSASGSSASGSSTTTQSQFPWWFFNSRLQRQRPMKY